MGDREARTQAALVCGHTGAAEDAASRRPARPDDTSVIVNRALSSASSLDFEQLAGLFNEAYSDYFVPISLDGPALALIVELWDIDLDASRVAGDEAFAFLAVRGERGWIGGMGVVPAARRRGLGEAVMRGAIVEAQARGLRE